MIQSFNIGVPVDVVDSEKWQNLLLSKIQIKGQWKKIIQRSKLNYKLWMAKANYSYMNSFGSLNEVKELPPFTFGQSSKQSIRNYTWRAEQYTFEHTEQYTIYSRAIHGQQSMIQ